MLTFFRKIRKSILETGHFRSYLAYAIGEVLLVVVGILIALQINNWNEERLLRAKEKNILQELDENLLTNIQTLEDNLNDENQRIMEIEQFLDIQEFRNILSLRIIWKNTMISRLSEILHESGDLRVLLKKELSP